MTRSTDYPDHRFWPFADHYVGAMKGVILASARARASSISATRSAPYEIAEAAFMCRSPTLFPERTVHVVVVDPGVGSCAPSHPGGGRRAPFHRAG